MIKTSKTREQRVHCIAESQSTHFVRADKTVITDTVISFPSYFQKNGNYHSVLEI